jgi:catechol 2,3-dioxygenase-like lactoylglutathione lyase family enzyme
MARLHGSKSFDFRYNRATIDCQPFPCQSNFAAPAGAPVFQEIHPILGTRDIERALDFYTNRLGFQLAFRDGSTPTNYAGIKRDRVELHMQFQFEHEMGTIRLRFYVEDPDALFEEYRTKDVFHDRTQLANTPWGTREFAFYDLDGNGLTFYRHLTKAELEQR